MELILHHESKVRNLEGPDMCHVELPPEFYSLINGPNLSQFFVAIIWTNCKGSWVSSHWIKSGKVISTSTFGWWSPDSAPQGLPKIPGLGGPVVVANRSKANGGSDDPWRYNWNSHGCSSWRPTDPQFSRKKTANNSYQWLFTQLGRNKMECGKNCHI